MDTIKNLQIFLNAYNIDLINKIEIKENEIIIPRKKPQTETTNNTLFITLFYDGYSVSLAVPILPLSIDIIEALFLFIRNEQNYHYTSFKTYVYN